MIEEHLPNRRTTEETENISPGEGKRHSVVGGVTNGPDLNTVPK